MPRIDGRAYDQLRPVRLTVDYLDFAEGSALIEVGATRVLCAATVEERVPAFLEGRSQGWVTAEYSMLPRATQSRTARESLAGRVSGRTHEIQRLIGRSLRAVVDLRTLGERTIVLDCDVLQADGGTRTAAITGAYVALHRACSTLLGQGILSGDPIRTAVAAISAGLIDGAPALDLAYAEDSRADMDCNVVMTARGDLVEVQCTAEGAPYSRAQLNELLDLATGGIRQLLTLQRQHL
jgi:ribonuclease PH